MLVELGKSPTSPPEAEAGMDGSQGQGTAVWHHV